MVCYRFLDDRPGKPVEEIGLRTLAYRLTVLKAAQPQMEHRLSEMS